MGVPTFNLLSICSGVGGLDLGVKMAVPNARTVCYVERELFCCEILVNRMAEGRLDEAPIWTDLRSFDGKPWRSIVDCLIGGYPCQPFSQRAKRLGGSDERYLWPSIVRIIVQARPEYCFFENVSGHLSLGFEQVEDDLSSMGYRVAAGLFTAKEVGAPHERERLFILAHSGGTRPQRPWSQDGLYRACRERLAAGRLRWSAEPRVPRVDDGVADWVDRIRATGNGVVPEVAALAWCELFKSLSGVW